MISKALRTNELFNIKCHFFHNLRHFHENLGQKRNQKRKEKTAIRRRQGATDKIKLENIIFPKLLFSVVYMNLVQPRRVGEELSYGTPLPLITWSMLAQIFIC